VLEYLLDRTLLAGRALEASLVADDEAQAGDEEGGLAGAPEDGVVVELGVLEEDLPVGPRLALPTTGSALFFS
jgi:hypothetical protein